MGLNISPAAANTPGGVNEALAGLAGTLAGLPAKRQQQAIEQQHIALQQQGLARQMAQQQLQAQHWQAVLNEQARYHDSAIDERTARANLERAREGGVVLSNIAKGLAGFLGKSTSPKDQAQIDHLNAETEALKAGKPNADMIPNTLADQFDKDWAGQQKINQSNVDSVGKPPIQAPGAREAFLGAKYKAAGYDFNTRRKLPSGGLSGTMSPPTGSPNAVANPTPSDSPRAGENPTPASSPNAGANPMPTGGAPSRAQQAPNASGQANISAMPAAPGAGTPAASSPSPWRVKLTQRFGGTLPPALETYVHHAEAGNPQAIQVLQQKYGP